MNPIDALFQRLRAQGRKAFMPFVTAGDPDLSGSVRLVEELARRGASLIEIGFPYSDPIADGPVIQASYTRALAGGVRVDNIFASIRELAGILPITEHKIRRATATPDVCHQDRHIRTTPPIRQGKPFRQTRTFR